MMKYLCRSYAIVIFFISTPAQARIYVQCDQANADVAQHVSCSTVSIADNKDGTPSMPAPKPPANIQQFVYPDETDINGKVMDFSKAKPALIADPANAVSAASAN